MRQTIGIIGSGMIGGQVGRLAVAAGFNVVICSSRGPETLVGLVSELGPSARAATLAEVAKSCDLIVLAVPLVIYQLPIGALSGQIVVDTMNYYPDRDGAMPEVKTGTVSTSELVQPMQVRSQEILLGKPGRLVHSRIRRNRVEGRGQSVTGESSAARRHVRRYEHVRESVSLTKLVRQIAFESKTELAKQLIKGKSGMVQSLTGAYNCLEAGVSVIAAALF